MQQTAISIGLTSQRIYLNNKTLIKLKRKFEIGFTIQIQVSQLKIPFINSISKLPHNFQATINYNRTSKDKRHLSDRMQSLQQNQFNKSNEMKKSKILPPLNHSPTSTRKAQRLQVPQNKPVKEKKVESHIKLQSASQVIKKERRFVPDEYDQKAIVLCQFCGGEKCPQQDYKTNKKQPNAIQGLHSNWITENILAMQRPSNRLIEKYNLLDVFAKYNINSILNLQQPGQHPYCGDGIDPMIGFSYDPQLFFNRNIRFQNEYWQDMTATTFEQMMKIMNVFSRSILERRGKISVHCHAGRGRTLMAINSWLIYYDRMTAEQTIHLAVEKREGVLTKTSQRDFLRDFQKELYKRWKSYSTHIQDQKITTFTEFVDWQNVSLLISERKKLNETPYTHGTILANLRKRMKDECKQIIFALIDLNDKSTFGDKKWGQEHQHRLTFLKTYLDKKQPEHIKQNQDIKILVTLLQDFYDGLPFTPISLHAVDLLRQQINTQRTILKDKRKKRQVKKQQTNNKILKRWQDIVKQRQSQEPTVVKVNSKIKQEQKSKQQPTGQIGIESRVKQIPKCSQDNIDVKIMTAHNSQLFQPKSSKFLPEQTKLNSEQDIVKSQANLDQNDNNCSEIQTGTLYLNVLTEPAVVHEIGQSSLCTFIDFVKFVIQLMDCYRNAYSKESEDHYRLIERCLLAKFSILLQSKKRYFPVLFRGTHLRESNLMKKIQKLDKYANNNIKYMAEVVMKEMIQEFSVVFKEGLNGEKFEKLILKIQKVNTNVDYFSKSHASSGGKFFSAHDAKRIYDQARI